MTSKEYKRFLEVGLIDASARILNAEGIRTFRREAASKNGELQKNQPSHAQVMSVCVTLHENFDQQTASRLEALGLMVEKATDNEIVGQVASDKLGELEADADVLGVEISD